MLKYLHENKNDYSIEFFLNELTQVVKLLGILETKIGLYHFEDILFPLLYKKEAQATLNIEGTQTTICDTFEGEIKIQQCANAGMGEFYNLIHGILFGSDYLTNNQFSHEFIQSLHRIVMHRRNTEFQHKHVGQYKHQNNFITNSAGEVVYQPPEYTTVDQYMDELIDYMNEEPSGTHPLIKAAVIHAQFESIHPFENGNGRVGRLLTSLYMYKAGIICSPFFYISESIHQDKPMYYQMLSSTRSSNYNEWIRFFLQKCIVQANAQIHYVDSLNGLYERTKTSLQNFINSPQYNSIIECLFTHPVLNSAYLANVLGVTSGQARRYLDVLEKNNILICGDHKRNKTYYFKDFLDLCMIT